MVKWLDGWVLLLILDKVFMHYLDSAAFLFVKS
jgi:hypothetical protein